MQTTFEFPTRPSDRIERNPLDFAGLLVLLLLLGVVCAGALWHFWFINRIYMGVSVAGVAVGGLTRADALQAVDAHLQAAPLAPVSLYYEGQAWPLSISQVPIGADLLTAINQAYLVGRQGTFSAQLTEQVLTVLRGRNIPPPLTVDEGQLRSVIQTIAQSVDQPGRPANQIGDTMIPATNSRTLDVAATTAAALAALQAGFLSETVAAPLVVHEVPVADTASPATAPVMSAAVRLPLLVQAETTTLAFALDAATLNRLMPSGDPTRIDEDALTALLDAWAQQIDLPARDARLRFNAATGGLTVLQTSQPGRQLEVAATADAIRQALATNAPQAQLVVTEVAPAVDEARLAELGIRELVASGVTYFKGSTAARVRNIEVAAEQFDGVVIPPDGIFSFNKIVENVTSANGFEDSLVIWGDQTVVGVGGGACQVSTTVFRAAYAAGLPMIERYNHGYIVDWYGEPGLDAAIFTPSVDFRFRNDTGAYLLVEPVVDRVNGVLTFNLYGTKPDRVVTIGSPVKTEIKQPAPPTYTVDETLPAGQKKQVEWEKPGMTVTVQRTIVENGTTRTDTLTSRYQPWRAVYLVAPDVPIPATPTPAPTEDVASSTVVTTTDDAP
jgi:vancomycin resistance protein YoaR